jgi:phosphoglycolate phosphatase
LNVIAIFDWDGTLCDSIDGIVRAMQGAAAERSLTVPPAAAVREIIGLGLPQALARLFPELPDGERVALADAYSRQHIASDAGPARLFEGAVEMLEALRAGGCELAVATGKSRRGLNRVLAGLGMERFFHTTRCADETRSKPDPLMLREILAERGKSAGEAIMIGDSEYDLEMAGRAGVAAVGVSFGAHAPERLRRHRPRDIVDDLARLPELVAQRVESTG